MSAYENAFELPKNIERYLAALAKLYGQEDQRQLQEIIVNSQTRVHEEWSRDNWDGGTYGHALYLVVPELVYLKSVKQKDIFQKQIRDDINKIHNVQNEFIEEVFLEMEVVENQDWRKESGLLLSRKSAVLPDAERRIWGDGGFRLFLTHKADVKKQTSELKERLQAFGVSCFVAHEDIHPTREWQNEIENALFSMDALAALMTATFHESDWTDQEVGCAFGRGVPIIAIKLGKDPYGFIGKFQALSCDWENADVEIVKLLVKHDRMLTAYINAVQSCVSYNKANALSKILPSISSLSDQQVSNLIFAFNENGQLRDSYGFNGTWAAGYLLSDDGYIVGDLRLSGCELESRKRKDLLRLTLNGFGVQLDGDALSVHASRDNFALRKHNLVQAMLAVNDLFYLAVPMVASLFLEDVASWLSLHDIRFTPKVKFTGKSGYDHLFDFVIPASKKEPERILQAINRPNRDTAQAIAFGWIDTKDVRPANSRAYAFLNDSDQTPSAAVVDALKSYDVHPVLWSGREDVREQLAA